MNFNSNLNIINNPKDIENLDIDLPSFATMIASHVQTKINYG